MGSGLPPGLPAIAANPMTMRHALLSVLSAVIHEAGGGSIEIAAQARESHVWIDVRPIPGRISDGLTPVPRQNENLEIALQLVTLFGGSLNLVPGAGDDIPFVIRLILPAVEQVPVLVIDDNVDTLRLFERYLTGSRYRFVGVQDPRQAAEVAAEVNPHAIVLDLMLPGVDGWEVLGRLREHPRTRAVPVLVCTILPHEDLALALGAAALIRKPINHQDFLSALGRQSAPIPSPQGHQTSC